MPANANQLLRQLIQIAPLAIIVLDRYRHVMLWNHAAESMFGWRADEVMDRPAPFMPEGQRDRFNGVIERGLAGEPGTAVELRRRDGSPVEVSLWAAPLRNEAGEIIGMMEILADSTASKLAKEELRKRESLLDEAQRMANLGCWEWDLASGQVDLSDQMHVIHGLPRGGFIGSMEDYLELVDPDDRERVRAVVQQALSSCEPFEFEKRIVRPEGTIRVLQSRGKVVLNNEGNPVRVLGLCADVTEQKRVQAALRESEARLRAFSDHNPAWTFIKDSDGRYLDINRKFEQAFGLTREQVIGKTDEEIFESGQAAEFRANDLKVFQAGTAMEFEEMARYGDGVHTSIVAKFPLRDAQGRICLVGGVATDITERKWLEQRLRESEARYRGLVERIPAITYLAPGDDPGATLYISPQIEQVLGIPANAFLSEPEFRIRQLHREDRERVLAQLSEACASRRVFTCEYRMIAGDGSMVWIRDEGNFIFDETGKPTALQGIMLDITDLKGAENALDESRKRLQALFDNMRDGILLVDRNAKHVDANPAFCELLGYSREEMLRMSLWDDVPLHRREEAYELWRKFLVSGRLEGEFTVLRKDGSTAEVDYRAVAHFMPDLHLTTIRDITARRRAEDELKQYAAHLKFLSRRLVEVQENERRTLVRELHDRTGQNLTAINLQLGTIREQCSAQAQNAILARVDDAMALVAATVEAMRDVMSNLRPPVLEDYGLLAGLRWYGEIFSQRTGLPVELSGVEPSPRLAPVAETALFRIAQEALTNVAKHANASRIEIALDREAKCVRLAIADNGRGFDVTAERPLNAGWGLLVIRERVEAVDGILQVDSAPGRGTRVVVEVPATE